MPYTESEQCVCCGLFWEDVGSKCAHRFCYICLGRGHDDDCIACEENPDPPVIGEALPATGPDDS